MYIMCMSHDHHVTKHCTCGVCLTSERGLTVTTAYVSGSRSMMQFSERANILETGSYVRGGGREGGREGGKEGGRE